MEIVKYTLENELEGNIDYIIYHALAIIIIKFNDKLYYQLSQNIDCDISTLLNRCMLVASKNGYVEVVRALLRNDYVDPTVGHNYAIRYASGGGHVEVVEALLADERIDPKFICGIAMYMAIKNDQSEIVKLLMKYRPVEDDELMEIAIARGSWKSISMLLNNGNIY